MLASSPSQIVVIHEPVAGCPDICTIGELVVYPTGVLEIIQDNQLMQAGAFESCVPVEAV